MDGPEITRGSGKPDIQKENGNRNVTNSGLFNARAMNLLFEVSVKTYTEVMRVSKMQLEKSKTILLRHLETNPEPSVPQRDHHFENWIYETGFIALFLVTAYQVPSTYSYI